MLRFLEMGMHHIYMTHSEYLGAVVWLSGTITPRVYIEVLQSGICLTHTCL